jgi:cell division protease FtsH
MFQIKKLEKVNSKREGRLQHMDGWKWNSSSGKGPGQRPGQGPGQGPNTPFGGNMRSMIIWMIFLPLIIILFFNLFNRSPNVANISYSTFLEELNKGNIKQVVIQGNDIFGEFKTPYTVKGAGKNEIKDTNFNTYVPSFGDPNLLPALEKQKIDILAKPSKNFSLGSMLLSFLPLLLLVWLGLSVFRRFKSDGQNIFSIGKSKARMYTPDRPRVTFEDVAGLKGTKEELREVIEFLKDPTKFQRLGGKAPKGLLLVGPPGTGKTLIARAVAGEAGVPFYSLSGSDFIEVFVGVGAARVRDLFEKAKRTSPSIIFIDELDSIGRKRGAGLGGGNDEREQTLNMLLSEMDGFEPNENVIVMAATNRPDVLDPALLRPGRFDLRVTVDMPTLKDRAEILRIHSRGKPLASDVDLQKLARSTAGFSGADLENLLNEGALLAARRNKTHIGWREIEDSRDKIVMGLERENMALTEDDRRLIAYHEGGHAVVASVVPNADPVNKVTIVPRGQAMGYTEQLPEGERYIYPREYILDRMAVMLGGRAAEELVLKTATSGAENDLKVATRMARKMVLDWGMSARLGHVAFGDQRGQVFLGEEIAERREYSEATAREVDEEVKRFVSEAYERAAGILKSHIDALNKVAALLMEKEEIKGDDIYRIVGVTRETITA